MDTKNNGKISANTNKRYTQLAAALLLFAAAAVLSWQVGIIYDCEATPFDLTVQSWFLSARADWLSALVIPLTHTSDTITIVILCVLLLLLPGRKTYGIPVTLTELCGLAIYKPMKHLFLRARPDISLHLVEQGGYSFPSGHSVTSVIVYGLLFYLIRRHCEDPRLRRFLSAVCLALAVLVGPSRIYVGVHWPTDVLTGWCIGGGALLIAIVLLELWDQRQNCRKEEKRGTDRQRSV